MNKILIFSAIILLGIGAFFLYEDASDDKVSVNDWEIIERPSANYKGESDHRGVSPKPDSVLETMPGNEKIEKEVLDDEFNIDELLAKDIRDYKCGLKEMDSNRQQASPNGKFVYAVCASGDINGSIRISVYNVESMEIDGQVIRHDLVNSENGQVLTADIVEPVEWSINLSRLMFTDAYTKNDFVEQKDKYMYVSTNTESPWIVEKQYPTQ